MWEDLCEGIWVIRERGCTEKKFEYFGCGERECSDICFGGWFGICFKECFVERGMGLGIENFYLSGRMGRQDEEVLLIGKNEARCDLWAGRSQRKKAQGEKAPEGRSS